MSVLAAAEAAPIACTLCGAPSRLVGVVDFHKSCLERAGKRLGVLGIPIYYRRCSRCALVFADTMLHWTDEDFARHIYNADYPAVDPDYAEVRPVGNARWLLHLLGEAARATTVIDYGGGNGRFAAELRASGMRAATIDPHASHGPPDFVMADLVTAFEVFEHAIRPQRMLDAILALMRPDGALIFSTLLQPSDFDLGWWYVAPRNGHVSLYSRTSLEMLLRSRGLHLASFSDGMHVAFRQLPAFLRHCMPKP
jgi:SAM-dependent methyltransferase